MRIAFETLGCRSNFADSVELQTACAARGGEPCGTDTSADVVVLNTCTVTDEADKEAKRTLQRIRTINPNSKIIVTGCLAEVSPDKVKSWGFADVIIGPGRKQDVLKAIWGEEEQTELPELHSLPSRQQISKIRRERKSEDAESHVADGLTGPEASLGEIANRSRYHLRIQEGCEHSCTYCIIPEARGSYVSRRFESVIQDVKKLSELGYREVVLTGTHLGGYGTDIGSSLGELMKALAEASFGPRIRLSSLDPNDVTPEIVLQIKESNVFCRHLHICIQSFSDGVLKRMNRRYRMFDVERLLNFIQWEIPNCSIGSDVICGFPGESREDVDQAIESFLGLPISYLHVFPYSEREGTAATRLDGEVVSAERKRRASRFRAISEIRRREFYEAQIGRTLDIVLEGRTEGFWFGTSDEFISTKCSLEEPSLMNVKKGERVQLAAQQFCHEDGTLLCG